MIIILTEDDLNRRSRHGDDVEIGDFFLDARSAYRAERIVFVASGGNPAYRHTVLRHQGTTDRGRANSRVTAAEIEAAYPDRERSRGRVQAAPPNFRVEEIQPWPTLDWHELPPGFSFERARTVKGVEEQQPCRVIRP